ncbi:galactose-6-phosphate isomerase subunit LacB [Lentibacillus cibarius]|uniref:Galactose-6-phosphate isomerase subunit LacB n=1 Tax=Lentibacillus cibarius TaxID=2583219 RepID=A0A549YET1_9BACI|nr:galactose-6-phosphate isomerase subunit LacB [Lentibacillus cibarius]TMN21488.1 galactose-6-phosphate isomerase subunit LacB [Lentibacillus cibarius]TRM10386.1 galactose-6-phosphate isomerase subunit LacB [Lentibacillus cibarius]
MKISIGCDHIVTEMKDHLVGYLKDKGYEVIDNGTYDKERTHYPIYGKKTAEKVVTGEADLGITICGTGVGISASANKVKGIRAALVGDVETARYAKSHLNANVLAMGGRILGIGVIEEAIDTFLETEYEETEESKKLIEQIDSISMNDESLNDEHYFDEFIEKWNNGGYPTT